LNKYLVQDGLEKSREMIWGRSSSRANLSAADQRLIDEVETKVMPNVKGDDKDRLQVLIDRVYAGSFGAANQLRSQARFFGFRV